MKVVAILFLIFVVVVSGCTQTRVVKDVQVAYEASDIQFTTPDGVTLNGNIYFPKTGLPVYKALILVHQLNGDRRQWDFFVPYLIEKNYAVLVYDTRYSSQTGNLENAQEDVAGALSYLVLKERIDGGHIGVIGASAGANVAYTAIGSYPALKTAVALSPSDRIIAADIPNFDPHTLFFLSDQAESGDASLLAADAREPKQVKTYTGTLHGVEILNNQDAVNDIFDWLQKTL